MEMVNRYFYIHIGMFFVSVVLLFMGIKDDDAPGMVIIGFLTMVISIILLIRHNGKF